MFEQIYKQYQDQIYRLAYIYVKNEADALDIVQNTFLKFYKQVDFENEEHIKRWLLRTCINLSKNHLNSFWRKNRKILDDNLCANDQSTLLLLDEVLKLPRNYKDVMYLHYYEGYSVKEISEILHIKESNVKQRLKRGREKLKVEVNKNEERRI